VTVAQKRSYNGFSHNIYTLISNPKKFQDGIQDSHHENLYSRIRFNGLKAGGYGWIPYIVMTDPRLGIKAKGIYAYFCVYTGSGSSAFPRKEDILRDLRITHNTYQRYYKQLVSLNYLTVVQRRINGQMSINDYFLNDNPQGKKIPDSETSAAEKTPDTKISDTGKAPDTKISDTEKAPDTKISDTGKTPDTKIQDTQELVDTQKSIQDIDIALPDTKFSDTGPDTKISDTNINSINLYNYSLTHSIYNYYNIINKFCSLDALYPQQGGEEQKRLIYPLFIQTLGDMCESTEMMKIRDSCVNAQRVIEILNNLCEKGQIIQFGRAVIQDYEQALMKNGIKNKLGFMRSCIWTCMLTFGITESKPKKSSQNTFHNFHQRETDYDAMILEQIASRKF